MRKLEWGIDFLGYIVLSHYRLPRVKTKRRIFKKLKEKRKDLFICVKISSERSLAEGGRSRTMKKLPGFLKKYFWEVDFEAIDPQKSAQYVVARLIDKGNDKAIRWLTKNYSKDLIKKVVTTRRGFSPKTANFWALVLDVDKRKVVCLQTPYLKMRQSLWPY